MSSRNALPQTINFLPCKKANFTVLDEMLAYSRYRTNPEVIRINQDVPTYFYAVQRSRLPIIAMLLDRGLSDTNMGEANQNNSTRNMHINSHILLVSSMFQQPETTKFR
ncbi:hypothetical protein [Nostoc sp.]|uniref:hypothetical protein n=1 Tax=Nostoc sp. TaxID=1180 RepID=UPI002FF491E1